MAAEGGRRQGQAQGQDSGLRAAGEEQHAAEGEPRQVTHYTTVHPPFTHLQ